MHGYNNLNSSREVRDWAPFRAASVSLARKLARVGLIAVEK